MKEPSQHLIAEVPRRPARVEMTIGIDLGDVWSHYCTLNEKGEAVDRGRFRTSPKGVEKWFTDLPPARVAMEAGTHSIWISERFVRCKTTSGYEAMILTPEQAYAIVCNLREPERTLTLLAAGTGLRISECLGLQWQDVNFADGMIHVRRTWTCGHVGFPTP